MSSVNALEVRDLDHYIFSYNNDFYLLGCASRDTCQIESPLKQKELWDVLKYNIMASTNILH